MNQPALLRAEIEEFPVRRGKVRDNFDLGDGTMLMVATDRLSTYDVVHPTPVPEKGKILTGMTIFWFEKLARELKLKHHLLATDVRDFGHGLEKYTDMLEGRSMLVRKAEVFPIECIARGYITGSGWKDYQKSGEICGIKLPAGLQQCEKLPENIFTPSTKAEVGHDENITLEQAIGQVGAEVMAALQEKTLGVFGAAANWAEQNGILLADTKLEWGRTADGEIILVDEVLTPDSSRYWPKDKYAMGRDQDSFDKQIVRNYVTDLGWNKKAPAPELPEEIVVKTKGRYLEVFQRITHTRFAA